MIAAKNLSWGVLAQASSLCAGLVLLPIILWQLDSSEVGIWFVFTSMASFVSLCELGFQSTIIRNVSYAFVGAESLPKEAEVVCAEDKAINRPLYSALYYASRRIYFYISLLVAFVLYFIGTIYLLYLGSKETIDLAIFVGWSLYASSIVVNFYYGYLYCFMMGSRELVSAYKTVVLNRMLVVVLSVVLLLGDQGVVGLSLSAFLAMLLSRVYAKHLFKSNLSSMLLKRHDIYNTKIWEVIRVLWHNAKKMGITSVGAFLISRSNIFIASTFLSLSSVGTYAITLQIFSTINTVIASIFQIKVPSFSEFHAKSLKSQSLALYARLLSCLLPLAIILYLSFIFCSGKIIEFIGSDVSFVIGLELYVMALAMLLELNHSLAATLITTTNRIPFVQASIISGVAIVVISAFLVGYVGLGVLGLVSAQFFVQILYNNWRWPLWVSRYYERNYIALYSLGFKGVWRKING